MLSIKGVEKTIDGRAILRGVDLEVAQGEILCLLGPSGCGKSTLLRLIAGLDHPTAGDIWLDGRSIVTTLTHQRGFGLMFQDFALFPHLDVGSNIAFGLRMRGDPRPSIAVRVREMLALVGLPGIERREVTTLSGGERQRVALARTLAPAPRLILLDEPMGALDVGLRDRLLADVRALINAVGVTAIYVTHDQQEAYAIADRIALMNVGRIEQIDTPTRLYRFPRTVFAARFLGLTNILPVKRWDGAIAHTALGALQADAPGEAPFVLLHPDGLHAARDGFITATIQRAIYEGRDTRIEADSSGVRLAFGLPAADPPTIGQEIRLTIDPAAILPLEKS